MPLGSTSCGWLISCLIALYMQVFEVCPSLLFARQGFPKTTLNSNAQAALLSMCGVSIVEQRQETDNGTKAGNAS